MRKSARLGRGAGFYSKEKIIGDLPPKPKRIFSKRKLTNQFFFYSSQLKFHIINELLKSGDGFSEKNFEISNEISNFLKEEFNLKTEWVDGAEFLELLKVPLKIRKTPNSVPIMVEDFQIKFGNQRRKKFFSGENETDKNGMFCLFSYKCI